MESVRMRAAKDFLSGNLTQAQLSRRYQVSRTTASRWARRIGEKGVVGVRRTLTTGRPPALTKAQQVNLQKMHKEGPIAHGYRKWTARALQGVILKEFGVCYHVDHVCKLRHTLNLFD